ncbi:MULTISPECIES: XdhC family protein [Psychrobacter]|uniref:Xanthine and CO dehydrogenase maturation factor n=1 Tax=Psychrobacter alimentarius TaxID=261164 RepID=A0ABN4N434_9GAMM|nr:MULTISPECIES: XdhC/CoxI family protein [Psychrobacter]AMT97736.1 Xanthine and CO dehydrogenase maturation factor [Psychrobacter alimentarius]QCB29976.1 XdhC/CoxI family protein [Psychrobacter sp. PAMC27889]
MNQIADILKLAGEAQQQNVDAVLATVVHTEGSAYRRAGAMMLICEDGRSVGMISGGCLEPHIIKRAFWLTRHGANVQVYQTGEDIEYTDNGEAKETEQSAHVANDEFLGDNTSNDWEDDINELDEMNFGLGCNGRVHVLFERLASAKPLLETITQVRRTQEPVTIATLIRSDSGQHMPDLQIGMRIILNEVSESGQLGVIMPEQASSLTEPTVSSTLANMIDALAEYEISNKNTEYVVLKDADVSTEWLIQRLQPQIRLLVCGAGNDVIPLVTMAKLQDWHVTVVDSRAQYATRARFSQADVVMHLPLENTDKLLKLSRNAAVALMSHSLSQDRARLDVLLEHPEQYQYLGQLGPSYRTERLINEISATKADPQTLVNGIRKIHYPIGYKLGGDGPEALALGILAQINAVMHEQSPPAEFSKSEIASSAFANA